MAPKGKKKAADTTEDKSNKAVKGCQQINVRHILCEKFAKKNSALEKLQSGAKFDEVAREFSEDKARQGRFALLSCCLQTCLSVSYLRCCCDASRCRGCSCRQQFVCWFGHRIYSPVLGRAPWGSVPFTHRLLRPGEDR